MTKLFVKNADCLKQYAQCKLFSECGNGALAGECKDVLKGYWNGLNSGLVDVEDVDLLYRKLCQCVRIVNAARARAFDQGRLATLKIRFTIKKFQILDEFQVHKFENNRPVRGATYYTNDEADARATMLHMVAAVTDKHEYSSVNQTSKNSITVTLA